MSFIVPGYNRERKCVTDPILDKYLGIDFEGEHYLVRNFEDEKNARVFKMQSYEEEVMEAVVSELHGSTLKGKVLTAFESKYIL
jgi:hypothetical protein